MWTKISHKKITTQSKFRVFLVSKWGAPSRFMESQNSVNLVTFEAYDGPYQQVHAQMYSTIEAIGLLWTLNKVKRPLFLFEFVFLSPFVFLRQQVNYWLHHFWYLIWWLRLCCSVDRVNNFDVFSPGFTTTKNQCPSEHNWKIIFLITKYWFALGIVLYVYAQTFGIGIQTGLETNDCLVIKLFLFVGTLLLMS
jgi:hypothetical protein